MCLGIALIGSEIPAEMVARCGLAPRLYLREGHPEYRFLYQDRRPRLPIMRDDRLSFARWGNGRRQSKILPPTGWTWLATIEDGSWAGIEPVAVKVPATFGLDRRGVWYLIEVGIRGLLVPDERGLAVVYLIMEPSSHYYKIMTGSPRMPVLIDQRI